MKAYKVIGLMSGTSLDGLDIAACRFSESHDKWQYEIVHAETIPYPENMLNQLRHCMEYSGLALHQLHVALGNWMGQKVKHFIAQHHFKPDVIASHGHTVFHQPEKRITMQIGDGHSICLHTNVPVICNFRHWDVLHGGQGAPLVPVGDMHLFEDYTFCLNLGGIANVSFQDGTGKRVAYDICPANMVLNHLAQKAGQAMDEKGAIAASGHEIHNLLEKLDQLAYYHLPYPKSLGKEWVETQFIPLLDDAEQTLKNTMHTSAVHIAGQIHAAIFQHAKEKEVSVLVTGGGAYNDFLIQKLKLMGSPAITYIIPPKNIVEFKEALIFAFMGLLRYLNRPNILQSVTGASKDTSSGDIIDY